MNYISKILVLCTLIFKENWRGLGVIYTLFFYKHMKKCKARSCATCEYLEEGVEPDFPNANVTLKVNHKFSCDSGYLLYKLTCKGCKDYYIGRTTCLKDRFAGHKIKTNNPTYRLQRMYIHIYNCARGEERRFTIMPFLKMHYEKISEMAVVESHYIHWLKPGLNTLF